MRCPPRPQRRYRPALAPRYRVLANSQRSVGRSWVPMLTTDRPGYSWDRGTGHCGSAPITNRAAEQCFCTDAFAKALWKRTEILAFSHIDLLFQMRDIAPAAPSSPCGLSCDELISSSKYRRSHLVDHAVAGRYWASADVRSATRVAALILAFVRRPRPRPPCPIPRPVVGQRNDGSTSHGALGGRSCAQWPAPVHWLRARSDPALGTGGAAAPVPRLALA
jgi:hypothetical protein